MAKQIVKGRNILLKFGEIFMACLGDVELSISRDPEEATCRDTGDFTEYEYGPTDWSITFSGVYRTFTTPDIATNVGADNVIKMQLDGEKPTVIFGPSGVGSTTYTGQVLISESSISGAQTGNGEFSGTLQGSGPLVQAVVAA